MTTLKSKKRSTLNLKEGSPTLLPPISKKYSVPPSSKSNKKLVYYPYTEKAMSHVKKDDVKFKIIAQKKRIANMSHLFTIDIDNFYSFRNYLQELTDENPDFKELTAYLK